MTKYNTSRRKVEICSFGWKKEIQEEKGLKVWSAEIEGAVERKQEHYKRYFNNPTKYNSI